MLPEVAQFILITIMILAIISNGLWISAGRNIIRHNPTVFINIGKYKSILMLITFLILAALFYVDDFSVKYVAEHSNSSLPLWYKFCAIWAGHEGSMLLWLFITELWLLFLYARHSKVQQVLIHDSIFVVNIIVLGVLFFIIYNSNPFTRNLPDIPLDGRDLNPMLQDFGLIIHPPILYMGYVGMVIPFALVWAGLINKSIDNAWVELTRPFVLAAWGFLTVGIVLGSWWAYYELGWGGWWFWDPVENASLLPWLVALGLLHSLRVLRTKPEFIMWVVGFALAAFILSIAGTFLVRSGIVTSVHAFARDAERGSFLLKFLGLIVVSSGLLVIMNFKNIFKLPTIKLFSRDFYMLCNNIVLSIITLVVLLGTIYPVLYEKMFGANIAVGPEFYNSVLLPIMFLWIPLMLIASYNYIKSFSPMVIAHSGVVIALLGMFGVSQYAVERQIALQAGQSTKLAGYDINFVEIKEAEGNNYIGDRAHFTIKKNNKLIGDLYPEKRIFTVSQAAMSEVAILPGFLRDFYIALGERQPDGAWSLLICYKPLMRWVWFGGIVAAFAAFAGVVSRRRIGIGSNA